MDMSKNYLTAAANLKLEGIANGMCVAVFVTIYLAYILNDFIMFTDTNSGDETKEVTALCALKIFTGKCVTNSSGIHPSMPIIQMLFPSLWNPSVVSTSMLNLILVFQTFPRDIFMF
jgi:hypothetical protein